MEDFDRVSARVAAAGFMGGLAGVGTAMYKGHPMARTVGLTALSCAMVGSACFTPERLAAIALRGGTLENELGNALFSMLTHACGGIVGGGISGALYIGKPIHGVIVFAPIMTGIGYAESLFQDMVQEQRRLHLYRQGIAPK